MIQCPKYIFLLITSILMMAIRFCPAQNFLPNSIGSKLNYKYIDQDFDYSITIDSVVKINGLDYWVFHYFSKELELSEDHLFREDSTGFFEIDTDCRTEKSILIKKAGAKWPGENEELNWTLVTLDTTIVIRAQKIENCIWTEQVQPDGRRLNRVYAPGLGHIAIFWEGKIYCYLTSYEIEGQKFIVIP